LIIFCLGSFGKDMDQEFNKLILGFSSLIKEKQ